MSFITRFNFKSKNTVSESMCDQRHSAVIGELKRLQVVSFAESDIERLPKEMMQLSDVRVLFCGIAIGSE